MFFVCGSGSMIEMPCFEVGKFNGNINRDVEAGNGWLLDVEFWGSLNHIIMGIWAYACKVEFQFF